MIYPYVTRHIDSEVDSYESQYPNDWKLTLCVTEFVVCTNLRKLLIEKGSSSSAQTLMKLPALMIVGMVWSGLAWEDIVWC
jgi:hypothetical protein